MREPVAGGAGLDDLSAESQPVDDDGGTDGVTRHEYGRSKARMARQIRNFADFQARTIAKTMP